MRQHVRRRISPVLTTALLLLLSPASSQFAQDWTDNALNNFFNGPRHRIAEHRRIVQTKDDAQHPDGRRLDRSFARKQKQTETKKLSKDEKKAKLQDKQDDDKKRESLTKEEEKKKLQDAARDATSSRKKQKDASIEDESSLSKREKKGRVVDATDESKLTKKEKKNRQSVADLSSASSTRNKKGKDMDDIKLNKKNKKQSANFIANGPSPYKPSKKEKKNVGQIIGEVERDYDLSPYKPSKKEKKNRGGDIAEEVERDYEPSPYKPSKKEKKNVGQIIGEVERDYSTQKKKDQPNKKDKEDQKDKKDKDKKDKDEPEFEEDHNWMDDEYPHDDGFDEGCICEDDHDWRDDHDRRDLTDSSEWSEEENMEAQSSNADQQQSARRNLLDLSSLIKSSAESNMTTYSGMQFQSRGKDIGGKSGKSADMKHSNKMGGKSQKSSGKSDKSSSKSSKYCKCPTTPRPTQKPNKTKRPSNRPSMAPKTEKPVHTIVTDKPTRRPNIAPKPTTRRPSGRPSESPTFSPTLQPTLNPTLEPTLQPTLAPTFYPTLAPTTNPSIEPTSKRPITSKPVRTQRPSSKPTQRSTGKPSEKPTMKPTFSRGKPTRKPTNGPTTEPSVLPTFSPTVNPTFKTTLNPTLNPTISSLIPAINTTVNILPFDPIFNARFGTSVSVSKTSFVVGTPGAESFDGVTGGAAYVYDFDNDKETVTFVQKLTKEESNETDSFGSSVSISGKYIVVGAPGYSGDELNQGAAYIYHKDSNDWDLFSPEPASFAFFGFSVAVNSNGVIAVGSPGDRGEKGSVYIFRPNKSIVWEHVFTIKPDIPELRTGYAGWSVAIDDENTVIVGAPAIGAAYVYKETSLNKWKLQGDIITQEGNFEDFFGQSVDIDEESRIVIGAGYSRVGNKWGAGAAYVYSIPTKTSEEVEFIRKLTSPDPAEFAEYGSSVSISSGLIAVGADGNQTEEVYLYYEDDQNNWVLIQTIQQQRGLTQRSESDVGFGYSVALDSGALAIGAPYEDTSEEDSGSVSFSFIVEERGTVSPTPSPVIGTDIPTFSPTYIQPFVPTFNPTLTSEEYPTTSPSFLPTVSPSLSPSTTMPSVITEQPSFTPTLSPTFSPTLSPTISSAPSSSTEHPTASPSFLPTVSPSSSPSTTMPTVSTKPSAITEQPSFTPTLSPAFSPTLSPTMSSAPSSSTEHPTASPSFLPTADPTSSPSTNPTLSPLASPSFFPTLSPSTTSQPSTQSSTKLPIPVINSTIQIEAFDPIENGLFGSSVSLFHRTFIVGSPGADSDGDVTGGAAFVYNISDDKNVEFLQKLSNAKLNAGDKFGFAVSVSGKYVVAGAPENDGDDINTGAAYVFQKGVDSDDAFSLVYDLISPTPAISAQFGWSVAVNTDGVIAVGAKGDRVAKGSVYIFKPNTTTWDHVFTIEPDVTQSFPNLGNAGWSVAIDKYNTVVVGAPFDGEGSSTGSVFVYKEVSEDKWELQGNKITLQEGLQGDAFGYSVDIDEESTLAIGVRNATVVDAENEIEDAGSVYVYSIPENITDSPELVQELTAEVPEVGANYGHSVSIASGLLAIGEPGVAKVYLYYQGSNSAWLLSEVIEESSLTLRAEIDTGFGTNVAVSSSALATGAPGNDNTQANSGSVSLSFIATPSTPEPLPTALPTAATYPPTVSPSSTAIDPSLSPSFAPTLSPSNAATDPSLSPSFAPTLSPSSSATDPSLSPSFAPTVSPSSSATDPGISPTFAPTVSPSSSATDSSMSPTQAPSYNPTYKPTICDPKPKINSTERFEAFDASENALLGFSVSVSNKVVVAGSPGDPGAGTAEGNTGAAYVFDYDDETNEFKFVQKLTVDDTSDLNRFGQSVAVNDEIIVVGAPQKGGGTTPANAGAAYVFEKKGDSFSLVSSLISPTPAISAQFGWSVALNSKGVIAIGAKGDRIATGSVYIFKPNSSSEWQHVYTLEPDAAQSFPNVGNAGWSVAIDDENTIAVGAPFDGNAGTQTGSVYVYQEVSDNDWQMLGDKITPADGVNEDLFGFSVDLDDESTLLIGSRNATVNEISDAGAAYVYSIPENTNEQALFVQKLVAKDPVAEANYGESVSISRNRIAIGAPNDGATDRYGAVYFYSLNDESWTINAKLSAGPQLTTGAMFGHSVSVSSSTLVTGAPESDIGANDSGSIYINTITSDCSNSSNEPSYSPTYNPTST